MNRSLNDAEDVDTPLEDMTRGFGFALVFWGVLQVLLADAAPLVRQRLLQTRLAFVGALVADLVRRHSARAAHLPKVHGLLASALLPALAMVSRRRPASAAPNRPTTF